jgi:hypothetical protein
MYTHIARRYSSEMRFSPENNSPYEGDEYGENTLHICDLQIV